MPARLQRHFKQTARLCGLAGLAAVAAGAETRPVLADESVNTGYFGGVAIMGYDPVAYFTDGHPEKGSAQYSAAFDDATYWFKNAEHRALFIADPDHYAPQFSGYCAMNVSRGLKVEADPEAWAIADGRLYVFSAKQGISMFQQQTAEVVDKATQNWTELRKAP